MAFNKHLPLLDLCPSCEFRIFQTANPAVNIQSLISPQNSWSIIVWVLLCSQHFKECFFRCNSKTSEMQKTCNAVQGSSICLCFQKNNFFSLLWGLHSIHFGLNRTNKTVPSKELSPIRGLLHGYRLFSHEVVKILFIKGNENFKENDLIGNQCFIWWNAKLFWLLDQPLVTVSCCELWTEL